MANEKDFEKRMTFIESMLELVTISIDQLQSSSKQQDFCQLLFSYLNIYVIIFFYSTTL